MGRYRFVEGILRGGMIGGLWFWAALGFGQQMTIGSPFHSAREGFFEQIGTQWSAQGRNWFVQFGGANLATPAFGGFQPGAGVQGGFALGGRGWSGQFQFSAAQGNTRTLTSATPSGTVINGAYGYVADTSVSPFVIGLIPVVGAGGVGPWVGTMPGVLAPGPMGPAWVPVPGSSKVERFLADRPLEKKEKEAPVGALGGDSDLGKGRPKVRDSAVAGFPRQDAPLGGTTWSGFADRSPSPAEVDSSVDRLAEARQSTAGQAVLSVAEARALHETETQQAGQEVLQWYKQGRKAEEAGKPNVAAIYYRMAARRATGPLQQEILARLKALQTGPSLR